MLVKKIYTLVFLRRENEILLGLKKRGFGVNKWNGFGGKVEPNETVVNAAIRELNEECCVSVKPEHLKNIAHIEFTFQDNPVIMDVRVFSATKFQGEVSETEEMAPKWFALDQIPFDNMWPDDPIWFPYMLSGKAFYGQFLYKGFDVILDYKIEVQKSMESFYANRKLK